MCWKASACSLPWIPSCDQLTLPSRRRVLLADTVGFVRNLPHALVTSFRATLEEVERAELLVHVRDAASPTLTGAETAGLRLFWQSWR